MNATEFAKRLGIGYQTALKCIKSGKVKTSGGGTGTGNHRGETYIITEEQFNEFIIQYPQYDKRPNDLKPGAKSAVRMRYSNDDYYDIPDSVKDSHAVVKQFAREIGGGYKDLANILTTTVSDILSKVNGFMPWTRREIIRLAKFWRADPEKLLKAIQLGKADTKIIYCDECTEEPKEEAPAVEETPIEEGPVEVTAEPEQEVINAYVVLEEVFTMSDAGETQLSAAQLCDNYIFKSVDDAVAFLTKKKRAVLVPEPDGSKVYESWDVERATFKATRHVYSINAMEWGT